MKRFIRTNIFNALSILFVVVSGFSLKIQAQNAPEAISYQAVIRDAETSEVFRNQAVYLAVEFLNGPVGEVIYSEEFNSIQTNEFGLLNLNLGQGSTISGDFSAIPWVTGNIWLRISVDAGSGLVILQETPFSTVPYAFYADESGSTQDGDTDPENELIEEATLNQTDLIITEAGQNFSIDLSTLIPDADADPSNEAIDSLTFNPETIQLNVFEGGESFSVNLEGLTGNADPTDEIQDLSLENNILTITLNDTPTEIDLTPYLDNTDSQNLELVGTELTLTNDDSPVDLINLPGVGNDDDTDSSNELVDSLVFNAPLSELTLYEAGNSFSIGLDALTGGGNSEDEIQDLELNGNILTITLNDTPTEIDLAPYLDNTDNQDLSLAGSTLSLTGDGTPVDLSALPGLGDDADADSNNEIQDLTLSGNDLSITNNPSATPIDLSSYLDNTDNQDLEFSGTTLSLTNDGTPVDLSTLPGLGDDGDADSSNELQDLSLSGNTLSLSDDATTVDLSGYLDNTDNQDLSLAGSTLSLTGDGTPVDLSALPGLGDDDDADSENEIQDLTLSGNELSITNNPSAIPVDLSPYLDNTDDQDLELSGTTLTLTNDGTSVDLSTLPGLGDDGDADPQNELQNLQLSGDLLSLSDAPISTVIDLSEYDNSALPEGHIFVGNASNQAENIPITGDIDITGSDEFVVQGLQEVFVSEVAPNDGDVLTYDATEDEWQPRAASGGGSIGFYSVDPLDFREVATRTGGDDLESGNALKFFDESVPFAMLLDEGVDYLAAPIHLPHGATITNARIYFRDSSSGLIQFRLLRKDITDYSLTNDAVVFVLSSGASGDDVINIPISTNNVVDNSQYSYRVIIRISDLVASANPSASQVTQRIYGMVIRYTL